MKYTIDYFIKKFKAIPNDRWCQGSYTHPDGSHCALGHCGHRTLSGETLESKALGKLFGYRPLVARINDGIDTRYTQKTSKGRILAALNDLKQGAKK